VEKCICWYFIHYWIEKCTVKQWNSSVLFTMHRSVPQRTLNASANVDTASLIERRMFYRLLTRTWLLPEHRRSQRVHGSAERKALSLSLQHYGSKWCISLHSAHCGRFILFTHHWTDTPASSWNNSNKIFVLLNLVIRLFNDCLNCRVYIELNAVQWSKVGERKIRSCCTRNLDRC